MFIGHLYFFFVYLTIVFFVLFLNFKKLFGLMDSVGEGEGGKIWENGIETCIISCMK